MLHQAKSSIWHPLVYRFSAPAITLILLGAFAPVRGADWPCFRGPNLDGVSAEKLPFGDGDPISLKIAWKRPLGSGYSGIAVVGDRLVTMFSDGKSDLIAAFSERDGKELWRYEVGPTYEGHDGSHTGPISTPLIADGRVFAVGPKGKLVAVSLESGEEAWTIDLIETLKAKAPFYGFGSSPFFADGVVIVGVGGEDAAYAGFEPATGKTLWTVGNDGVGYQAPCHHEWDGQPRILIASNKHLYCLNPKNGETAWQAAHTEGPSGNTTLTPIPLGAYRVFMNAKNEESTVVDLVGGEDGVKLEKVWEERSIRATYNISVRLGDYIYGYNNRFLVCIDAATGNQAWRSRAPGDGFTMAADGRLVVLTKEGTLHIARASSESYDEIADLTVFKDISWTPPSIANGRIYARSLGEIARIDFVTGKVAAAEPAKAERVPGARFPRFLKDIEGESDKSAAVDRFLTTIESFPLVEPPNVVHFLYRSGADDAAIASDFIGSRQERTMNRVEGTDLFYYSTTLEPDVRINYVFYEGAKLIPDPRNPRQAETTSYNEEMNFNSTGKPLTMSWVSMPEWKPPRHLAKPGGVRGKIETHELDSELLGTKHKVEVYLPPGYESGEHPFPVVYIHGGEHARAYGQFVEAIDNLAGTSIRPVIAVFMHQSAFRQPKFVEMFAKEIVPFIDGKYRTVAGPEGRANYGAGFSAFDALLCTVKNPGVVSKLGIQSLHMFDFQRSTLGEVPSAADLPLTIYIEWGRYDMRNSREAWDTRKTAEEFVAELRAKGYNVAGGEVPDGTGWPSWKNRTNVVLQTLFPIESAGR